jgi:hypothetical protein
MGKLKIGNKSVEYSKYLTQKERGLFSLSLKCRLNLLFLGYAYIGTYKPEDFTAPAKFYLVRYKNRYFISYRQSWSGTFFIPEVLHNE